MAANKPENTGHGPALRGAHIMVISRCAQTLVRFRSSLLAALMERSAKVVALGAGGDRYEEKLHAEGVPFMHIPVPMRGLAPIADFSLLIRLIVLFRRARPAIVHSFTIKPAIFGTLAARIAGVPTRIVTITGLGHAFTTAAWPVRKLVESLYRLALRSARPVFFQNEDDRDLFLERGLVSADRVRMVPGSGVDLQRFAPRPLPCLGGSRPRFVMVARLLVEKGVREYLEAARQLQAEFPGTSLRLVGGEDPRNPSRLTDAEVRALRASADVEWTGEVDDVQAFLADCDVVVLPSYREGLPRSLLEAAAMGRALVTTDVPGCRSVVSDGVNGYLVPARDAQALAQAMRRYVESPETVARHGAASARIAQERFDEKIVIARSLDAYVEALTPDNR